MRRRDFIAALWQRGGEPAGSVARGQRSKSRVRARLFVPWLSLQQI